jgi:gliding motility-associated-like protein
VGFVVNDNTADIVRLNFSTLSTVPSATSLGKIGGTNNPHSISKIFREGGNLFAFLPNSQTNGLSRIQFSGCANSSIPSSTIQNPGAIQYNASGTYNITLSVDEGLPTQTSYCKSIKVTQPVPLVASSDTSICLGDSILLNVNGGVGYKWIPTTNLSNPNVSNPIIKPIVSTQYIVSAINSSQCFSNDTVQVDVKQPPVFTLTPNAVSICKFDSVQLIATGGDIYSWSSASPLPTSQGNNFFVKPPTTSVFTVVAQTLQCSFKDTLATTIVVNPLPIINLSKSNDLDCVNGSAQLVASGGVRYVWTPTTGLSNPSISNPIVTGAISGKYYVEVSTLAGCKSKDSVELLSISNPLVDRFFMPSGFTPNGDRLNDCFGIKKWGTIVELDFKIFNRWGQLVFYTNTADKCWDGKYKGVMQDAGAFVYTIHAKTLCGRVDKKGSFILIR